MAEKSIKRNYIYNMLYQILLIITPFIATPYISRVLAPNGVGIASYVQSVASFFVLFATMGIYTYGQREISYAQDSIERRSVIFWNTKILSVITSLIAVAVYVIFSYMHNDRTLYLVFVINILAVTTDVTWFFQGLEEFGQIAIRNIIFRILNIAYYFVFVRKPEDVVKYAFGLCFFVFLSNCSLWIKLPKYVKFVKKEDIHPFANMKTVWELFLPTIAIQIYTVLDKTMIGVITKDSFENGYYEQSMNISKMALTIITALSTVIIPRIGYYFENGDNENIKKLMYKSYRFVWMIGIPLCLGLIIVADNFIPWFLGDGFERSIPLLMILSVIIIPIGISTATGSQYLIPIKKQNVKTKCLLIGAGANFLINLCLIPIWGAVGAAIASVIAEMLIAVLELFNVRKELETKIILSQGIHYMIAGIIMAAALVPLRRSLEPSVLNTMIIAALGAAIYVIMLLLLKDEFFISNVKQVLSKVQHKGE